MRVPGPWLAKLTGWWLWWFEILDRREEFIECLHKKYGSIVQIAPRMISVNNARGLQEVYSITRKLDRPALPIFHTYKSTNLVSTTDANLHHERRKPMRRLYAKRSIDSPEIQSLFRETSTQLVNYVAKEYPSSSTVAMKDALRFMSCDNMSAIVYGKNFALNLLNDEEQRTSMKPDFKWQDDMFVSTSGLITALFPDFVMSLRSWNLAPKSMNGSLPDGLHMHKVGMDALNATLAASIQEEGCEITTLMETLVGHYSEQLTQETQNYILSESLDHFWAGIVTTVDGLTALLFQLSLPCNIKRQHRLRQEVFDFDQSGDLTDLTFLNCVIKETLRLYPSFDGSLDRLSDNDIVIDGIKIPPNMEIGGQAHSIHRNAEVFPSPETWEPERWEIDSGSEQYRAMNRQFFTFGAGPRMCIGMNIAYSVMRHTVASIYRNFQTSLPENYVGGLGEQQGYQDKQISMWKDDDGGPIKFKAL